MINKHVTPRLPRKSLAHLYIHFAEAHSNTLTVGCRGVRRTRGSSASILEESQKLLALEASWNALVDLGMSRAFESKYASVVLFLHCPHSLFRSHLVT